MDKDLEDGLGGRAHGYQIKSNQYIYFPTLYEITKTYFTRSALIEIAKNSGGREQWFGGKAEWSGKVA